MFTETSLLILLVHMCFFLSMLDGYLSRSCWGIQIYHTNQTWNSYELQLDRPEFAPR